MSLQEIVKVTITRETKSVTQTGFGTMLILGPNANFESRTQEFSDADSAMAAVLAGGSDAAEYKAAVDAFAQNPRVVKVKIGAILGNKVITDDAGTWTAGTAKVTVNGVEASAAWITDKNTSMTALATAIQALDGVATATYSSGSHTITIVPDSGVLLAVSSNITGITGTMTFALSAVATEDVDDALDAIVIEDDDWYGLCAVTRTAVDQEAIADWVEAKKKIYVAGSADSDIINLTDAGDTTTIAALFKAAAYARSAVVYCAAAATEYPDAALLGKILPYDPGTYTAKFKTLASITVDNLTGTQSTNARDKNANVNEEIGGVNIIREGTVAEGEFIDVIVFVDWLEARITEGVYSVLVNNIKVPYTTAGMASIRGEIEKVLKIGYLRGGISDYAQDSNKNQIGGYVVTLPEFADIPSVDKANRILRDVEFTAWLSGAIHAVVINGVVTL
jgi:hypothetical protein